MREDVVSVRDLWNKADLGTFLEGYKTSDLAVHDSQMLRLSRSKTIVGTANFAAVEAVAEGPAVQSAVGTNSL